MEKLLTQEIIDQLPKVAYWENDDGQIYTSVDHLLYINSLNVASLNIPIEIINLVKAITVEEVIEPLPSEDPSFLTPTTYDEAIRNSEYIPQFGEEAWFNPEINKWVSSHIIFEGAGVNSNKVTGWMKRFNGMAIDNSTATMFQYGALLHNLEITDSLDLLGRSVLIYHYSPQGTNGIFLKQVYLDKYNNMFGVANNMKLYVPGGRRLAFYLLEGNDKKDVYSYPQLRISYRRILK